MSSLDNSIIQTPAAQLARLSWTHGYRFDGDAVHLNAMFALLDPAAHERAWALQLWACPSAPSAATDLDGHIVAEIALPPMGELADETEHFEVSALAWPPAGAGEYVMVLVLASGQPGHFHDVHDFAVYPRREVFVQPRLRGNVGYRIDGARVEISVGSVENPRPAANTSGTLSLELWALSAPFTGGRFQGHHLAGLELGSVSGQNEWTLEPIDLAFTSPPAGNWQIALMLREWTSTGFTTRDFISFPVPFVSEPVEAKVPAAAIVAAPAQEVAKPAAPVLPVEVSVDECRDSQLQRGHAAAPVLPVKVSVDASPKRVSVNTARVKELAAVKGLSAKIAEGIVKKRPFASLDDLREVKGLGAKILAKIRAQLKL